MAAPAETEGRGTRLILYVGKGGVGKTTMAAATAVRAAEMGHHTLVVSTDIAHSLGDVLDTPLGAEPQEVADRLDAQEINVLEEVRRTWGRFQDKLADFLRREGISDIQADELAIIPGMEEVAALVQIGRKSRTGEYDCIVVDAAPTGETIRLLSMPEAFQWYAGRIEAWRGRIVRLVGPFLRGMIPNLDVVDGLNHMVVAVLHVGPTLEVKKQGKGYLLRIPMPNVELDRLSLTKHADELYVDVGNFRRRIALPLALAGLEPGAARVHAGTLEIPFSGQPTT